MRFLLAISLVFLMGCTSFTPVYFDVLKPATVFIDIGVASVTLANVAPAQRDVSHFVLVGNRRAQQLDSLWNDDFNSIALNKFQEDLTQKNFFDSVYFCPTADFTRYSDLSSSYTKLFLDSLALSNSSQGVLVLSKSQYRSFLILDPISNNNFWGYLQGVCSLNIDFYNAISGKFEDSFVVSDTVYLDGQYGTFDQLNHSLPTPTIFVGQMAAQIGQKLSQRYVPSWLNVERKLFTGGSYFLIEGGDFAAKQNWPEATKAWRFAVDKGSGIVKARACYNLAVMAEMQGDIASATSWLKESLSFYSPKGERYYDEIKLVDSYQYQLKCRELELIRLNEQIGEAR